MKIFIIIFGIALVLWGLYRIRTDEALIGQTKKGKTFINFLLSGQASGLGQLLSGILCIILGVLAFIIK